MKKISSLHFLIFAVYPILHIFSRNIQDVPAVSLIFAILIALICSYLLQLFLSFIFKDENISSVVATLIILWFFYYGYFFETARLLHCCIRSRYLLLIWTFSVCLLIVFLIRKVQPKEILKLNRFLSLVSLSLIVLCLVDSIYLHLVSNEVRKITSKVAVSERGKQNRLDPNARDIYYIVLDSYASKDVLKKYFDFDNTKFYEFLKEKGFWIPSNSFSNYWTTKYSLAASLNMEYVHYEMCNLKYKSAIPGELEALRNDNKVIKYLKNKGYSYINIGFLNMNADVNLCDPFIWEEFKKYDFYIYLMNQTVLSFVSTSGIFLPGWNPDLLRSRIENSLEEIGNISTAKSPKFVFAHILCPHNPFVFKSNGEKETFADYLKLGEKGLYVEQLVYLNKKVERIIDRILSSPGPRPIIVLQSDHGPLPDIKYFTINKEYLEQRYGILCAMYLPGFNKDKLEDFVTPVNIFRIVFDNYFDSGLILLENKSYNSNNCSDPCNFKDISGLIKK